MQQKMNRCKAINKTNNKLCQNNAKPNSDYCGIHKGLSKQIKKPIKKWSFKVWWIFVKNKILPMSFGGSMAGAILAFKTNFSVDVLLFGIVFGALMFGVFLSLVFGTLSWLKSDLSEPKVTIESILQSAATSDLDDEIDI